MAKKQMMGLFIFLTFFSCTAPVYFAKTLPALIPTDATGLEAGFANRYDYTLPGAVREKYRDCYHFATSEIIRNMQDVFGQSELIRIRLVDTLLPGLACSSPCIPLPPDSAASLCLKKNTQYLIVLESLNFWVAGESAEGDDENSKLVSIKTQNVFLFLRAGFSLYGSSGTLLHQDSITYRTLYTTRLSLTSGIWLFEPGLKKSGPGIVSLSKSITEEYYNKFLPRNTSEMRILYAGKKFRTAIQYIEEKNWDEALRILLLVADSSNPKLARQAAHNLAVLYEIKGDMNQSEFWLKKSTEKNR